MHRNILLLCPLLVACSNLGEPDAVSGQDPEPLPLIRVQGNSLVDYFESKGISWTAWVFDPVWSPQLIENWQYEPTRQGRFFRDKLTTLNPER